MLTRDTLPRRLTLKQLRLVAKLGEISSLYHAAEALNTSQPAATKLLKDLEIELGLILFTRTNRGVVPTEYGEALIRHAKLVLAQLEHAADELGDLVEGTGGRIIVGTLLAASAYLLPTAIARLRAVRPQVRIEVVEGTNDRLMPALQAGDLDFVVGRLPEFRHREALIQEPLYEEHSYPVVRSGHPLTERPSLTLADLTTWEWILQPPETTLRRQIEKAFYDEGLDPPRPAVQSVTMLTNRTLLLSSDMIGVWPSQVVADDVSRRVLSLLPIRLLTTTGPVGISRRRNGKLSPAATALVDELKAVGEAIEAEYAVRDVDCPP